MREQQLPFDTTRTPLPLAADESPTPTIYDWDTDEEHSREGDRLKKWRAWLEKIVADPTLQGAEDQAAIRRELDNAVENLSHWDRSRRRRAEFQRRGVIPRD